MYILKWNGKKDPLTDASQFIFLFDSVSFDTVDILGNFDKI